MAARRRGRRFGSRPPAGRKWEAKRGSPSGWSGSGIGLPPTLPIQTIAPDPLAKLPLQSPTMTTQTRTTLSAREIAHDWTCPGRRSTGCRAPCELFRWLGRTRTDSSRGRSKVFTIRRRHHGTHRVGRRRVKHVSLNAAAAHSRTGTRTTPPFSNTEQVREAVPGGGVTVQPRRPAPARQVADPDPDTPKP